MSDDKDNKKDEDFETYRNKLFSNLQGDKNIFLKKWWNWLHPNQFGWNWLWLAIWHEIKKEKLEMNLDKVFKKISARNYWNKEKQKRVNLKYGKPFDL